MTCAQLRTKTRTSISWKICYLKSGFQILYAVEQFSSLFSKDKLKQGARIHHTHDPPSPRISWENCRAVPSQQFPHLFCGAGIFKKDSPRQERVFQTRVYPSHWLTAMPCWWAPLRARQLSMRLLTAHVIWLYACVMWWPWVGVCVPLALIYW